MDAVTENKLVADVYTPQIYDLVDVQNLKIDDTILHLGEEVTVDSIEKTETGRLINGGYEYGGINLLTEEGTNGYVAYGASARLYLLLGTAEFTFADEVTVYHWIQNEDGSVFPEQMTTDTIAASEVKDFFAVEGMDALSPLDVRIHVVDYVIDEISIVFAW